MRINILKEVNKVYAKQNPSTYLRKYGNLNKFITNRKNFLLKLKLTPRLFYKTKTIDFGSGSGQNTLVYDWLGSRCTLVEYDKKSCANSKKLFKKFAKNKFKIINKDIFKTNLNKKFDFVISNGVAHHTSNPKKNIRICSNHCKKNGFFILGIGETNGFFQRNLQRLILFMISKDKDQLIYYSKILFPEHLSRSIKYSGRTIDEVIYDTYLNPCINTLTLEEILKEFKKNNLLLYSSNEFIDGFKFFLSNNINQFKLINTKKREIYDNKQLRLNEIQNISLSNNIMHLDFLKKLNNANFNLNKLTKKINNQNFFKTRFYIPQKELLNYKKNILNLKINNIIDRLHNKIFFREVSNIFKILSLNLTKDKKFIKIRSYLKNCKKVFKGVNGVGMNYYVRYKLK